MAARRRQEWSPGDVFSVPLTDGDRALGQVLDVPLPNVASCALYDFKVSSGAKAQDLEFGNDRLISLLWTTPDLLKVGKWLIVERRTVQLPQASWPNESLRGGGWVGATVFGSAIVESFLDAFFRLRAWDDWHDPHYLDQMLISPDKKPDNLIYVRP